MLDMGVGLTFADKLVDMISGVFSRPSFFCDTHVRELSINGGFAISGCLLSSDPCEEILVSKDFFLPLLTEKSLEN
jgi:hypothetical protein